MKRWDLEVFFNRTGSLTSADFEPGNHILELIKSIEVLVIGAGGLGCEILKNLALSSFQNIHVIDMDTIDVSNLNRQFLFRQSDVGKPKATVSAEFIKKRVPSCNVTPYHAKIQDFDAEFYKKFSLIICGLDSIEARRWINALVYKIYDPDNPLTTIPIIDGGTEGFKGQSRVIIPGHTSCYECSMDMFVKRDSYPICTIANTPRLPEHCIEWASVLEWPRLNQNKKFDLDNAHDVQWVYNRALKRAEEYNISGVTYRLTQGVVKNIVPALASTNAIIAASCSNEALKMVSSCAPMLKTYMMYTGDSGIYTFTFEHEKKTDCSVCGSQFLSIKLKNDLLLLDDLFEELKSNPSIQMKKCSLRSANKSLYMRAPPVLEEATRSNLQLTLKQLGIQSGDTITATDAAFPFPIQIKVFFQ